MHDENTIEQTAWMKALVAKHPIKVKMEVLRAASIKAPAATDFMISINPPERDGHMCKAILAKPRHPDSRSDPQALDFSLSSQLKRR